MAITYITLKQCSSKDQCVNPLGSWLPATAEYFYYRAEAIDGFNTKCKCCKRAHKTASYRANQEEGKARTQRWRDNNPEAHRNYTKQWRREHPQQRNEQTKTYQQRNPEKARAHHKVKKAVEAGKLPKVMTLMCDDCGGSAQEYHHADYSKPLEVTPLCQPCHQKRHNRGIAS